MISGERGERTDKADQHGSEALRAKSQSGAKACEGLRQKSAQQFRSRQASQHDNTDGGDNTHGIFDRSHSGQEMKAAERFHRGQYQADRDEDAYAVGQQAEAFDHLFRYLPQAEQEQKRSSKYRQILQQAFRNGEAGKQTAGEQTCRHGSQSEHDPSGEKGSVFLPDHAHTDRNGEDQSTAEDCRCNDAGVAADAAVGGQFCGQLVAAHINGQYAAEHGRICTDHPVQGNDYASKYVGKHRCEADHAGHRQGSRA